jgi:multidrug resistance efflux pump
MKIVTIDEDTLMIALSVARSKLDYVQHELVLAQSEVDFLKSEVDAARDALRQITCEIERRDHAPRRT